MSPLAGRGTDCGIFKSKSALRLPQLSTPGRQRILPFPGGDCASAHAASVSISVDRSDGSFENFPTFGSANHGGMDSALSRGGWRWRMAESLRTFRRASGRCPRRDGNFGNAARGSAAHRDKSSGDSPVGASCANDPLSPQRRDQSAPLRTRNTRSSWLARIWHADSMRGLRLQWRASCSLLFLAGDFPDRGGEG